MLRMSRTELHALVWSKPITEIAREYGVRGLHVARACDAYEIARPRAGHWQKAEYGKRADTVALDSGKYPAEQIVTINPTAEKAALQRSRQWPGGELEDIVQLGPDRSWTTSSSE